MTRAGRRGQRAVSALQIVGLVVLLLLGFRVATGPRLTVPSAVHVGQATMSVSHETDAIDVAPTADGAEQTVEARRIRRVRPLDAGAALLVGALLALGLLARQTEARRLAQPPRRVLTVTWRDSVLRRGPPTVTA